MRRIAQIAKARLVDLAYRGLSLFGPGFSNRQFSVRLLARHVFIQKILRINSHVPWPVHWMSQVNAVHKIVRGNRCPGLAMNCYIDGRNSIKLGNNLWMGPRVSLISMNHDTRDYRQYIEEDPIVIGDNCWLGTGCSILPGVRLGNHVIVAAGAVVTKRFEENDIIIAGVPARIVKRIAPYEDTIGCDH
jgi:acetyltransferase-like isoleucine patch superfamily enzyme